MGVGGGSTVAATAGECVSREDKCLQRIKRFSQPCPGASFQSTVLTLYSLGGEGGFICVHKSASFVVVVKPVTCNLWCCVMSSTYAGTFCAGRGEQDGDRNCARGKATSCTCYQPCGAQRGPGLHHHWVTAFVCLSLIHI